MTDDGTGGTNGEARAGLRAAWAERVAAQVSLGERERSLLDGEPAGTIAAAVLGHARASEDGAVEEPVLEAAASIGRTARDLGIGHAALQEVFGRLHDAMVTTLLGGQGGLPVAASLAGADATGEIAAAVHRTADAVRAAATAASEAWFDERGRAFRHDIKTPLQAASLNLELLTLECAEKGLDTEALDVIQESLDRAVEMLRGFEPVGR